MRPRAIAAGAMLIIVAAAGCRRESRDYEQWPASAGRPDGVPLTTFQPGSPRPAQTASSQFQDNAYGLAEGKRLYAAYNCNGCHAQGGGGIGPALMDDKWIYGYEPQQIYATIVQGRPNGMPTYGGRIPEQQLWEIVAYVQSLSGQSPKDAATSRDDDMFATKPEMRKDREGPIQTGHR